MVMVATGGTSARLASADGGYWSSQSAMPASGAASVTAA
jgi:hypothetical protein